MAEDQKGKGLEWPYELRFEYNQIGGFCMVGSWSLLGSLKVGIRCSMAGIHWKVFDILCLGFDIQKKVFGIQSWVVDIQN